MNDARTFDLEKLADGVDGPWFYGSSEIDSSLASLFTS